MFEHLIIFLYIKCGSYLLVERMYLFIGMSCANVLRFLAPRGQKLNKTLKPCEREDLGYAENCLRLSKVKPDCCHTPAVVSTLLTPLPVSCPLTTPLHYIYGLIFPSLSLSLYICNGVVKGQDTGSGVNKVDPLSLSLYIYIYI